MKKRTVDAILYMGLGAVVALLLVGGYRLYSHYKNSMRGVMPLLSTGNSKLQMVLNYVKNNYVDSISIDDIQEQMLPHFFEQLDPHSEYIPAEWMAKAEEPLRGYFDGIGISFTMGNDTVIVQTVMAGGPSQKVGIMEGDRIHTVDDDTVAGRSLSRDSIMHLLRGVKGSKVKVGVSRKGSTQLIPFTITRDRIPINSVEVSYMIDERTGFIRLARFSQTTPQDFQKALISLSMHGMEQLILDLRGNGGGFMGAAHFVASQFLQPSDTIVYTEGRARERNYLLCLGEGPLRNIPLVVLIDELSASSSEIVAGAIQDNDRGLIVGRRSFGKGLVQEQILFSDGSGIRLTTQRYYTPSGRSIQKPYKMGEASLYDRELEKRWEHGEFVERDSIWQDSSEVFFTTAGRKVYGGGGIMPDYFVPLDTGTYGAYYRKVVQHAYHFLYAQSYLDKNRSHLQSFSTLEDLLAFLDSEKLLEGLIQYVKAQGVPAPSKADWELAHGMLLAQVKAYVARGIFDNAGFYPVMQEYDSVLQKALALINDPKAMRIQ